jgi:hypothetical protein
MAKCSTCTFLSEAVRDAKEELNAAEREKDRVRSVDEEAFQSADEDCNMARARRIDALDRLIEHKQEHHTSEPEIDSAIPKRGSTATSGRAKTSAEVLKEVNARKMALGWLLESGHPWKLIYGVSREELLVDSTLEELPALIGVLEQFLYNVERLNPYPTYEDGAYKTQDLKFTTEGLLRQCKFALICKSMEDRT